MATRKKSGKSGARPRKAAGKTQSKGSPSWTAGDPEREARDISSPPRSMFVIRLVVVMVAIFLGAQTLKLVKTIHLSSNSSPAPAAPGAPAPAAPVVMSHEMDKPVTERRMTKVFTFDGFSTKWGYSGWTKDGSANPNLNKGIFTDNTLGINGNPFDTGIGTHAPSVIVFDLKGKAKKFHCRVGADGGTDNRCAIIFKVYGDKRRLFQSPVMKVNMNAIPVDLNVTGYQELTLKVDEAVPGSGWGQADWVEIKLE